MSEISAKKPYLRRKIILCIIVLMLLAGLAWRFWPHAHNGVDNSGAMGGPNGHGRPGQLAGMTTPVQGGQVQLAVVPVYLTALGTVIPNATVTVTSQVSGTLTHVYFKEGEKVEVGQLLAQIDPRSYQATLAQYQGDLSQNQAMLKSARLTLARYQKLYAQDSLVRQDLETQTATVGQ